MATQEKPSIFTIATDDGTNMSLVTSFYNTNSTTTAPRSDYFEKYVTQYLYIAIGCLGMVGNLFVLVVIMSVPAMRKKLTNIYIINQSFIDFTVSFFLATSAFAGRNGPYAGVTGMLYCKIWATKMFLWGLLTSSTYNLVALTVERYLEVVHPIWHKINFNHKKAYISVGIVWVMGPLYNGAYMMPTTILKDGLCSTYSEYPSEFWRKTVGFTTVILLYIIPLCIMIYSYGRIILRLTSKVVPKTDTNAESSGKPAKEDTYSRAKKNTVKTLCIVALCFVLCWSWNQVYFLMMNLGYPDDFVSIFYHFTVIAVFLNCCINPFIYSAKYEQFQDAAKKMFCSRFIKKKEEEENSSTATSEVAQ